jgi:hypothetical protein
MGRKYSGVGSGTAGTNKTMLGMTSATTIRPELFELDIACGATPADLATIFLVRRYTAAGTSTAVTPLALDPANPAALAAIGNNHTVEPTYSTGSLYRFALNQRAAFRWVAAPGSGFKAPATAANGIGLQSSSSGGTAVHGGTFLFEE